MILFVLCEVWSRPSVGFSNNLISVIPKAVVCVCVWNGVTVTVLLLVSLFCAPRSLFIPSHLLLLVFLCLPGNLIIRSLSAPLASRSAALSLFHFRVSILCWLLWPDIKVRSLPPSFPLFLPTFPVLWSLYSSFCLFPSGQFYFFLLLLVPLLRVWI